MPVEYKDPNSGGIIFVPTEEEKNRLEKQKNIEKGFEDLSNQITTFSENFTTQLTKKATQTSFDIRDYGAKGDDSSFDNLPSINRAILACYNDGGGEVVIPPKTFYIKPTGTTRIILKPNVSIRGVGKNSKLKVMNNSGNYYTLMGHIFTDISTWERIVNVTISGFSIDQNMSGNTTTNILDSISTNNRDKHLNLITLYDYENVTVENMELDVCSVNTMIFVGNVRGANKVRIRNNRIRFKRGTTTNPYYDNTSIYIQSDDYLVEGNYLWTDNQLQAFGGIECHFGNGTVRNNKIENYSDAIHVMVAEEQLQDINILSNDIVKTRRGVSIWSPTYKTNGVNIKYNTIRLYTFNDGRALGGYGRSWGVGLWGGQVNKDIENVSITDNKIYYEVDESLILDWIWVAGIQISEYNRVDGTTINYKNVEISRNVIKDSPVMGIQVGGFDTSKTISDNVRVYDNTIINCAKNSNVIPVGSENYKSAIRLLGTVKNSLVEDNQILDLFDTMRLYRGIATPSVLTANSINNTIVNNKTRALNGTVINEIRPFFKQTLPVYIQSTNGAKFMISVSDTGTLSTTNVSTIQ